ncbi:MAG TPA: D-alanine--D-alanine ligase family protein [Actinomycetota bacterium]|nr:D-alanine--D-alanine ligase family protein [Actinomycetota bacterium]
MRVGVIFGGRSVEHDVSIVTAHQAMAAVADRHEVVPIYIDRDGHWFSGPGLNDLAVYREKRWAEAGEEAFLPPVAGFGGLQVSGGRLRGPRTVALDVVVPAIHGTYGEDGTLQGLLEMADIPYTGSGVAASAVGMDKELMKTAFAGAGLPLVPHVRLLSASVFDVDRGGISDQVSRELGYPVFVKPARAGSSVGIGKASNEDELAERIEVARHYDDRLLIEKSMEGCIEINCSVLGRAGSMQVSVCEQPVAWQEFLSFDDKYLRGGKSGGTTEGAKTPGGMASLDRRIPAPISDELTKQVQENATGAFAAVGAEGVARVDCFVNEATGETWVMEINTMPGSFAFYLWEATGKAFPELMEDLIGLGLERHEAQRRLTFSFDSQILDRQSGGKANG